MMGVLRVHEHLHASQFDRSFLNFTTVLGTIPRKLPMRVTRLGKHSMAYHVDGAEAKDRNTRHLPALGQDPRRQNARHFFIGVTRQHRTNCRKANTKRDKERMETAKDIAKADTSADKDQNAHSSQVQEGPPIWHMEQTNPTSTVGNPWTLPTSKVFGFGRECESWLDKRRKSSSTLGKNINRTQVLKVEKSPKSNKANEDHRIPQKHMKYIAKEVKHSKIKDDETQKELQMGSKWRVGSRLNLKLNRRQTNRTQPIPYDV